MLEEITVSGARQHNLKNISVRYTRVTTLTVITGLSGSGKSSLAFDTIYAEGQRRYVETLSTFARQFLDQMERPDVDSIDGLSPSISIDQKTTGRSPRSTVGTITEIYDYLRLLYSSIGIPHCPVCGSEISRQTTEQILKHVLSLRPDDRILVMAPIVRGRKGEFKKDLEKLARQGFVKARIDGVIRSLEDDIPLDKRRNHTIEVIVDRLLVKPGIDKRLEASIETATKLANGLVLISVVERRGTAVFAETGVRGMRGERAGTRAAVVFLQQPLRRVRGMRRHRQHLGVRSRQDHCRTRRSRCSKARSGPGAGSSRVTNAVQEAREDRCAPSLKNPWEKLPPPTREALLAAIVDTLGRNLQRRAGRISGVAHRVHVAGSLPVMRRQAAAPGQPRGARQEYLDRRIHRHAACRAR